MQENTQEEDFQSIIELAENRSNDIDLVHSIRKNEAKKQHQKDMLRITSLIKERLKQPVKLGGLSFGTSMISDDKDDGAALKDVVEQLNKELYRVDLELVLSTSINRGTFEYYALRLVKLENSNS